MLRLLAAQCTSSVCRYGLSIVRSKSSCQFLTNSRFLTSLTKASHPLLRPHNTTRIQSQAFLCSDILKKIDFETQAGTWKLSDGSVYSGDRVGNQFHGLGTLQYAAGGSLQGEFRDGLIWKGSGSALVGDAIYEGEWDRGQCHGYGKMQYSGGETLEGLFKEGMVWNGSGVLRLKNGEVREGTWKNGKMEGMGRQRQADGRESVGEFRGGKVYTGITARQFENGQKYSGGVQEGKRHGQGRLVNADGSVLKGEFQQGRIYSGEGVLVHGSTGDRHEGRWVKGLLHGYGIVTRGEEKLEGHWQAGVLQGDSCYVSTAWATYEGSMLAGKRHGPGKLQYTTVPTTTAEVSPTQPYQHVLQRVLEGEFREGAIHSGMGLVDSRWPELYQGDWVVRTRSPRSITHRNGQKHPQPQRLERQLIWGEFREGSIHTGKGWFLLDAGGAMYSCSWVDGVRVGELRHTPAEEVDRQSAVYMLLVQEAATRGRRRHRTATTLPDDPKGKNSNAEHANYYPAAGVNGAVFSGLLDDRGRYDGHGTLTLLSGDHLEGHFHRGKLEGPGEHWYATGAVFRGMYHNNARHGEGVLTNVDGSVLQGVFQHGHIYTGSGVLVKHRSGDRYEGNWEKGHMQGPGSITYAADGSTVTGRFLDGVFRPHKQEGETEPTNRSSPVPTTTTAAAEANTEDNATATSTEENSSGGFGSWLLGEPTQSNYVPIKLPPLPPVIAGNIATDTARDSTEPAPFLQQVLLNNGDLLTGVFPSHFGKLHGYGEYRYTDTRNVFRGYFRRGTRHGVGILYYADGRTLEGEFRHGNIKNGRGLLKRGNGEYYDGVWVNRVFTGTGRKLYANGRTLEGEFRDGNIWTGHGHSDYGGGHIYEGHYQNGLMHGAGVFCFPDGRTLSGEFHNGELHTGRDTSTAADGSVVSEIVWEDGRRVT